MKFLRKVCFMVGSAVLLGQMAHAASTVTYTYDARGRLVTVAHTGAVHSGVSVQYTYDKANNRIRKRVTGA